MCTFLTTLYYMWCSGGGGGTVEVPPWCYGRVGRIGAILCLQVRKGSAITWSLVWIDWTLC